MRHHCHRPRGASRSPEVPTGDARIASAWPGQPWCAKEPKDASYGAVVIQATRDGTVKMGQKATAIAVHVGSRIDTDSASSYRALKGDAHACVAGVAQVWITYAIAMDRKNKSPFRPAPLAARRRGAQ